MHEGWNPKSNTIELNWKGLDSVVAKKLDCCSLDFFRKVSASKGEATTHHGAVFIEISAKVWLNIKVQTRHFFLHFNKLKPSPWYHYWSNIWKSYCQIVLPLFLVVSHFGFSRYITFATDLDKLGRLIIWNRMNTTLAKWFFFSISSTILKFWLIIWSI
jgi:hypothetical protein